MAAQDPTHPTLLIRQTFSSTPRHEYEYDDQIETEQDVYMDLPSFATAALELLNLGLELRVCVMAYLLKVDTTDTTGRGE